MATLCHLDSLWTCVLRWHLGSIMPEGGLDMLAWDRCCMGQVQQRPGKTARSFLADQAQYTGYMALQAVLSLLLVLMSPS